jgi:hypothetical protein
MDGMAGAACKVHHALVDEDTMLRIIAIREQAGVGENLHGPLSNLQEPSQEIDESLRPEDPLGERPHSHIRESKWLSGETFADVLFATGLAEGRDDNLVRSHPPAAPSAE